MVHGFWFLFWRMFGACFELKDVEQVMDFKVFESALGS